MPLDARTAQALEDMARFARDAIGYTDGLDFAQFVHDHRTHRATMYAIATVAEASHRVAVAEQSRWPHIPWPLIWGMRNIIMHEYGRVDLPTVYRVARQELPVLLEQVQAILSSEA